MKFSKVIIWGHKLHSHTHSYIHGAFYKAFKHLGYETLWLDDTDDVNQIDFNDCLFLTEGQVDKKIPLVKNSKYILHNCEDPKYTEYSRLNLQVYSNGKEKSMGVSGQRLDECIFYDKNALILYQPWATDLLAEEIEEDIKVVYNKTAIWVGSIWGGYHGNETELNPFIESCKNFGYTFEYYRPHMCSFEQNKDIVRIKELAPAIVGRWQKVNGYIPCRIFKNISYGKPGLTNSETVYNLLEGNVIFADTQNILEKYAATDINEIYRLFANSVKLIKEKHTYVNRIKQILDII